MAANGARRVVTAGSVLGVVLAGLAVFAAARSAAQEATSTLSIDPVPGCVVPFTILPATANFENKTGSSQSASATVTLSQGLVVIDGCMADVGTCMVVDESTVKWSGTLMNNQSVTIQFKVQAVFSSAQLCANGVFQVGSQPPISSQDCVTTCARTGAPALGWWQGMLAALLLFGVGLYRVRRLGA